MIVVCCCCGCMVIYGWMVIGVGSVVVIYGCLVVGLYGVLGVVGCLVIGVVKGWFGFMLMVCGGKQWFDIG